MRKRNFVLSFLFFLFILVSCLVSCKIKTLFLESYEKGEKLFIPHYFIRLGFANDSELKISEDSTFNYFLNKINSYELNIEFVKPIENKFSDSIWIDKRNRIYHHNKIDTSFIINCVKNSKSTFLIPVIDYKEIHSRAGSAGYHYKVRLGISLFIIKEGEIIYMKSYGINSNSFFYVTKNELDKSKIKVDKLWSDVIREVMQPYIDRLK